MDLLGILELAYVIVMLHYHDYEHYVYLQPNIYLYFDAIWRQVAHELLH